MTLTSDSLRAHEDAASASAGTEQTSPPGPSSAEPAGPAGASATPATRAALLAEYDLDPALAQLDAGGSLPQKVRDHLQRLVDFAVRAFDVPAAAINLIDDDELRSIAIAGAAPVRCDRNDSICDTTLGTASLLVVPDTARDARFAANPYVNGDLARYRFYAGGPLRRADAEVLGALCLLDERPRELSPEQQDTLRLLTDQVVEIFELHRRTLRLDRAVEELTSTRIELERSNACLAAFAGQVGHDLRSPLAGIQGFLEMAEDAAAGGRSADVAEDLGRARSAITRMSDMLDGLLDYARRGSELPRDTVPMDQVLDDVLVDLRQAVEGTDVEIERTPLPEVFGDGVQLRAVVQNLLSNAIKFRHPDRPSLIRIVGETREDEDYIAVIDNGIGIPAEQRAEAFILLNRLHNDVVPAHAPESESERAAHVRRLDRLGAYDGSDPLLPYAGEPPVDGVGIGLATCERIIGAHGGQIGIDDGIDGGICIWFTLPR